MTDTTATPRAGISGGSACIRPLVFRHAEDAAFYWTQIDTAIDSCVVDAARLTQFQRLLDCHLGGLHAAAEAGWDLALSALSRWRQAGEAFVCATLAFGDAPREAALLELLGGAPDQMLRGVISALASAPHDTAVSTIARWSAAQCIPAAQVAALRALSLLSHPGPETLVQPLAAYFTSVDPHVRAAAARLGQGHGDVLTQLLSGLADTNVNVRAEAAIALAPRDQRALQVLRVCVAHQGEALAQATGWPARQGARRLARWVSRLARSLEVGDARVPEIIGALPPRHAMTFILWHGDLSFLDTLLDHMAHPAHARFAGFVWQSLTGVDLEANGLVQVDYALPHIDPSFRLTHGPGDVDHGLLLPNVDAIRAFRLGRVADDAQGRSLMGRRFNVHDGPPVLARAPQILRAVAAAWLQDMGHGMDVRGPWLRGAGRSSAATGHRSPG